MFDKFYVLKVNFEINYEIITSFYSGEIYIQWNT